MKNSLMREVANQSNIINIEGGFEKATDITANCTAQDLYSLKAKLDTALSHFIDEYDWTCSHLKLIVEATVCWHYCRRDNTLIYTEDNDKYLSKYAKEFYEELRILDSSESRNISNSNSLSFGVQYNDGNKIYVHFLTERMFKFIISKINEVVTNTLSDGSTIQNLHDLSDFFSQAIPCWENAKTNGVLINILHNGSTIQNLHDLNDFFSQAIPAWQNAMKKTPQTYAEMAQIKSFESSRLKQQKEKEMNHGLSSKNT